MTNLDKASLAVRNNAAWCDAMLRAHGCATHVSGDLWFTTAPAPRYYPNVVTLCGSAPVAPQLAAIGSLAAAARDHDQPFAVKDSFNLLNLEPLGFRRLFSAEWLYLPPGRGQETAPPADASWQVIATAADLASWEAAWGNPDPAKTVFTRPLLDEARVRIIAGRREGRMVAGCVTYCDAGAAGYTNLFLPDEEKDRWRASAVAMIGAQYPDLPIVGYESGDDLAAMRHCGFEAVGTLQVWMLAN